MILGASIASPDFRATRLQATSRSLTPEPEKGSSTPADSYLASEGVERGRLTGKIGRWVAQGALLGMAGTAAVAAISFPPLIAGMMLGASGFGLFTARMLSNSRQQATQSAAASDLYHATLQERTTLTERRANFEALETMLRTSPLPSEGAQQSTSGSRSAKIRTADDGLRFLWKGAESGDVLRRHVPGGSENRREVAAYLVDKRLGHYARVPPTVEREIDGETGVATLMVDKAWVNDDAAGWLKKQPEQDAYRRVAIFDNVIGNLDRHNRNFLITEEGRSVPIDHGLAFPLKNGYQGLTINYDFASKVVLNPGERQMLADFLSQREAISAELSPHLEPRALEAMFSRVEGMLESGATEKGWRWTLT